MVEAKQRPQEVDLGMIWVESQLQPGEQFLTVMPTSAVALKYGGVAGWELVASVAQNKHQLPWEYARVIPGARDCNGRVIEGKDTVVVYPKQNPRNT